jgi:serine/threonine protein kinase/CheY-like chemotaxis protein
MRSEPITADILVVDDHPHNLEVLRLVLEAEGHRVHVEQDGRAALHAAANMPFDLALIDVRMPNMNGYELCERLKGDPRTRHIPVIFLSALDEVSNKVQAFESGGDDYIVKPFKIAEVLARVGNQLRNAAMHRRAQAKNEELRQLNAELVKSKDSSSPSIPPPISSLSLLPYPEAQKLFDGKYELEEIIGHGGFGEVHRARHVILGRQVAIKIIRLGRALTPDDIARVRLEGMTACRVDHPNAIAVWDAGVTATGVIYLVMELLSGHSLRYELIDRGRLSVARSLSITRVICDVLATAHAAGVIHRDIKPDNIFLHKSREGDEVVKVVDFGIAKLVGGHSDATATANAKVIGTPEYLAPERLSTAPYDGRSDIYSLGCMMYELLCGRVPFVANKEAPWMVAALHLGQEPTPLRDVAPWVSVEVAEIVHSALHKKPENRPSAATFLTMLDQAISHLCTEDHHEFPAPNEDLPLEERETRTVPMQSIGIAATKPSKWP